MVPKRQTFCLLTNKGYVHVQAYAVSSGESCTIMQHVPKMFCFTHRLICRISVLPASNVRGRTNFFERLFALSLVPHSLIRYTLTKIIICVSTHVQKVLCWLYELSSFLSSLSQLLLYRPACLSDLKYHHHHQYQL